MPSPFQFRSQQSQMSISVSRLIAITGTLCIASTCATEFTSPKVLPSEITRDVDDCDAIRVEYVFLSSHVETTYSYTFIRSAPDMVQLNVSQSCANDRHDYPPLVYYRHTDPRRYTCECPDIPGTNRGVVSGKSILLTHCYWLHAGKVIAKADAMSRLSSSMTLDMEPIPSLLAIGDPFLAHPKAERGSLNATGK